MRLIKINNSTFAKLGKNESVSLSIIDKICIALECDISSVVQIRNK